MLAVKCKGSRAAIFPVFLVFCVASFSANNLIALEREDELRSLIRAEVAAIIDEDVSGQPPDESAEVVDLRARTGALHGYLQNALSNLDKRGNLQQWWLKKLDKLRRSLHWECCQRAVETIDTKHPRKK